MNPRRSFNPVKESVTLQVWEIAGWKRLFAMEELWVTVQELPEGDGFDAGIIWCGFDCVVGETHLMWNMYDEDSAEENQELLNFRNGATRTLENSHDFSAGRFSSDCKTIVGVTGEAHLKLWDAVTGVCLKTFAGMSGRITFCCFSQGGTKVLSSSGNALNLWDCATGACLQTMPCDYRHSGHVEHCSFSQDDMKVLSSSGSTIKLWDCATGECLRIMEDHSGATGEHLELPQDCVSMCEFSADGQMVLSASGKTLKLWCVENGQCRWTLDNGHSGPVVACGFSPNGQHVLSGCHHGVLQVWSVQYGNVKQTLGIFDTPIVACSFSPNANGEDTITCILLNGRVLTWGPEVSVSL
jgi:WD40 repeat protein